MATTGELIPGGDESKSKPIDYIGNHTESEFVDMRRAAKSVRYSSHPVCRPVSTRRDWQADTAVRSLVSEQAAVARKIENENKPSVFTPAVKSPSMMFELAPSEVLPPQPLVSSLLSDRAAFRTLVISHVQTNNAVLSNPSFASIVLCLFTKSEDELAPVRAAQTSNTAETLFGEECEDGLIRH